MIDICVLGCSHTSGMELYDPFLFKDYYKKYKNEDFEKLNFKEKIKIYNKINKKINNFSVKKYFEFCRQLSWPKLLEKELLLSNKSVNIENFSFPGVGIDFFRKLYLEIISDEYCKKNFDLIYNIPLKDILISADLLVWQLTNEPRYTIQEKNKFFLINDINLLDIYSEIFFLKDYYSLIKKQIFLEELINFVNLILIKRAKFNKKTILITLNNNKYIDKINLNKDDELFNLNTKDKRMFMGHINFEVHKEISEYIKRIIL